MCVTVLSGSAGAASAPCLKRTVACSTAAGPSTEEDHDPSVSADTGARRRGLRLELLHVSAARDAHKLKGPRSEENPPRSPGACRLPAPSRRRIATKHRFNCS